MSDENNVELSGPLTVQEVPGVYRTSLGWRKAGLPAVVDLANVEQADSSAVALLLEWLSWARAAGRPLTFANPPESLRIMAALSEVDTLLDWEAEA